MSQTREVKLKVKEKELLKVRDKILALDDEIAAKVKANVKKREDGVSNRVYKTRQFTHHQNMNNDIVLRVSDRDQSIRTYSKVDSEQWKYHQVREWFNSGAPASPQVDYQIPAETGYMLRLK